MGPHRGRAPGRTVTYQLLRPYPTSASGRVPPQRAADKLTLLVCRWGQLAVLDQLVVVILDVVDDPQDLDEAEGGSQPPQGRLLLGVDVGHGPIRLPPWRLVAAGPEMQVDAAALELGLVDLALAIVFAAGLERQDLKVAGVATAPQDRITPSRLPGTVTLSNENALSRFRACPDPHRASAGQ